MSLWYQILNRKSETMHWDSPLRSSIICLMISIHLLTIFTLNSSLLTKLEFFSPRLNRLDLLKGLILWNCNMKSLNSFGSHFAMFCSEKKCLFRHRILLLISLFLNNSNIHLDSLVSFALALPLCQVNSRILKDMLYTNWRSGTSNSHF